MYMYVCVTVYVCVYMYVCMYVSGWVGVMRCGLYRIYDTMICVAKGHETFIHAFTILEVTCIIMYAIVNCNVLEWGLSADG